MATWAAVGYLVVVGSAVVFVLYLVVLRFWAASRAAYGFVLIPFVTVALSAWLDNEPLGVGLLLGGLLVLSGVYVGALRPTGPASTPGGSHLDADIRSSPHSSGAGLVRLSCLQDSGQPSTGTCRVVSLQLRSGRSSSQCAAVGPSAAWWNDKWNDGLSSQRR